MWLWMFSGPFSAGVMVRQISSISLQLQQQRETRRARKKRGDGEKQEDESRRWEKRWLCRLHLNRISHRHKRSEKSPETVPTTNLWHSLPELEEPASTQDWNSALVMFCTQLNVACLLVVAQSLLPQEGLRTSPLYQRCCCSNLFLSTQNATWYAVYAALLIEFALAGTHAHSCLLQICSKTCKNGNISTMDCLFCCIFGQWGVTGNVQEQEIISLV